MSKHEDDRIERIMKEHHAYMRTLTDDEKAEMDESFRESEKARLLKTFRDWDTDRLRSLAAKLEDLDYRTASPTRKLERELSNYVLQEREL